MAKAKKDYAKGERKLKTGRTQYDAGTIVSDGAADSRFVTDNGYALTQIQFDTNTNSVDPEVKEAIVEIGKQLEDAGIQTQYSVEITQENTLVGPGEVVGLLIAAMVLTLALGSLVAAGLPILSLIHISEPTRRS